MASGLFNLKQVNQAISQGAWSGYIAPRWVEYLVVAGGGGAGRSGGGGGGAGGLLTGIVTVTAGSSYTVTIGTGGAGSSSDGVNGSNGVSSVFGSISSTGGGGGGGSNQYNGNPFPGSSGGSGGGGSWANSSAPAGGSNVANQGNIGGFGKNTGGSAPFSGGGGGGAGTIGGNGGEAGGFSGSGIASAISGTVTTYAYGGAGGLYSSSATASAGSANLGNGGSGGNNNASGAGGNGGSGIVVVRYPGTVQFFTGGTLSYANGYIIHTFFANGTLAPTTPTPYVTDYQISRSLRFNSADSANLTRTPASASNRKTFTFSGWIKRGKLDVTQYTIFATAPGIGIRINDDAPGNQIRVVITSGNALIFTPVLRDPSAWYHIVVAVDTTQTVAADRVKLYINNQLAPLTSGTYPTQNADSSFNNTVAHQIGSQETPVQFYDGNMAELNFIDGQALTPSSFGYTNPATGVWSPLAFVGTYGTNGFELNFSDNSNTTAATLGKDYSGNGNNFTPNNFSVTAGAGNDSLVDSPTSYGTDTGVGGEVRGNYCTWNAVLQTNDAANTYANGNLEVSSSGSNWANGTISTNTGSYYFELTPSVGASGLYLGINNTKTDVRVTAYSGGIEASPGGGSNQGSLAAWSNGDIIGVAVNGVSKTVQFYRNGSTYGTLVTYTTALDLFPFARNGSISSSTVIMNAGQRAFAYTAPSGFKALCTQNLPTPTIGATSNTLASSFFAPVLYTGTGATQSITVGFQPDFTWFKVRNQTYGHALFDSVRGAGNALQSNNTNAEAAWGSTTLTAFTSTGLTLGADTSYLVVNSSGNTFVAWNWRAGNNAGASNSAGSITSTVSANTTSGFSVVTYTGNGANATVGHGIGIAPSMVIVKQRNTTRDWIVYNSNIGATKFLTLDTTDAAQTAATFWNSTAPTSTVFSIGTDGAVNTSAGTYVAYCFAEVAGFSKIGSYIGNGVADGPFIYCGFRPAFVMFKNASSTGAWGMYDRLRAVTYNPQNAVLYPNYSNAENIDPSYTYIDFVSNGIKIRSTGADFNYISGNTYIFMAFAENPFKTSLAR